MAERPSEYTVVIAGFETSLLQDIAESVNEIKPAHIAITYNSHDVEVGKMQEYVSTHVVADSTIETVECVKYATYDTLKNQTYKTLQNYTYAEILQREGY